MGKLKKVLIVLLVILVGGYFYAGYYVFEIAGKVPCAVGKVNKKYTQQLYSPDGFEDLIQEFS